MRKVMGGVEPATQCGIKVNGTWCTVVGGREYAESQLGTQATCDGGAISGSVTNWCCASCTWNNPE